MPTISLPRDGHHGQLSVSRRLLQRHRCLTAFSESHRGRRWIMLDRSNGDIRAIVAPRHHIQPLMVLAALALCTALPSSAAWAQSPPQPPPAILSLTVTLRANVPLSRMVIVADTSRFDEKFEALQNSGIPGAPTTFHQFVERERMAGRVETRAFNSQRRASVDNVNRSVVYRIYYRCSSSTWQINRHQLLDPPNDATGTIEVNLNARCT